MNYQYRQNIFRNLPLHYLCSKSNNPDKPLLFFVHGFPDNAFVWEKLWGELEKDFDWMAPFLPGTYEAQKVPLKRYSLDKMVMDFMQLLGLEEFSKRKVIFIGHDLGGPIAAELNENMSSRSAGLVLINSFSFEHFKQRVKDPKQLRKSYYMLLFQTLNLPEVMFKLSHKKMLAKIYNAGRVCQNDDLRHNPPQVFQSIRIYRQFFKELVVKKLRPKKNQNKKMLILGLKDPFLTIPNLDEVNKYYSNAQLRVLPLSHWPHRSDPARIGKLVSNFIRQ
jgi:pimeloyl-ACP methyl ester carboxylesterase